MNNEPNAAAGVISHLPARVSRPPRYPGRTGRARTDPNSVDRYWDLMARIIAGILGRGQRRRPVAIAPADARAGRTVLSRLRAG